MLSNDPSSEIVRFNEEARQVLLSHRIYQAHYRLRNTQFDHGYRPKRGNILAAVGTCTPGAVQFSVLWCRESKTHFNILSSENFLRPLTPLVRNTHCLAIMPCNISLLIGAP